MNDQPPPGQGPVDPRGAFTPPRPPQGSFHGPQAGPTPVGPASGPVDRTPAGPLPAMMAPLPPRPAGPNAGHGSPQMPYPPYPPMMMPPPRRGSSAGWIALTLVLVLLLVGSILLNLILIIAAGGDSSQTQALASGNAAETVAVIPVEGIIEAELADRFYEDLERAAEDANVKAIIVQVDSPGGTVTASDEMYQRLLDFKAETGKPIVVHMRSVAASGGYYIACAADSIVAERTTLTGSIGVLLSYLDLSGFAEKTGIRTTTLVADGSPFKNAIDTFDEADPSKLAHIEAMLDEQYALFRDVVLAGRQGKLKVSVDQVANGKIFTGAEALNLGLVDANGLLEKAVDEAAQLAALTNPRVVRYEREPTLAELLGFGDPGLSSRAVGGVTKGEGGQFSVSLDPKFIDRMRTPRLMFLWQG